MRNLSSGVVLYDPIVYASIHLTWRTQQVACTMPCPCATRRNDAGSFLYVLVGQLSLRAAVARRVELGRPVQRVPHELHLTWRARQVACTTPCPFATGRTTPAPSIIGQASGLRLPIDRVELWSACSTGPSRAPRNVTLICRRAKER